jgi:hypothetical protein
MSALINLTGVKKNEKEPDKFQQYEEEKNPRLSRQNVHQGRQIGLEQETCKGQKEINRITLKQGSHGKTILWQA